MRSAVKAGLAVAIVLAAAYFFVFPVRTYMAQKSAISAEVKTISVLKAENAKLSAQKAALDNDATVAQIARQDYDLVRPGQQAFIVLPSPAPRAAPGSGHTAAHHWYSVLEFWN